ncbi:MAG: hypothetical protein EB057_03405 [Microbacteriaceae bacterium]|nr:hypothetical protein [Micrococcales bacterium]NBX94935.1 hypothetical protein [Actinomycetota bacterium]NDC19379.1 hypothetical protein [Microbacteriaceae bacterium]NDE69099.1 hypothetical protein [Microbacteriaceae bacterium]
MQVFVKSLRSTNKKRATIDSDAFRPAELGKDIWNDGAGMRDWQTRLWLSFFSPFQGTLVTWQQIITFLAKESKNTPQIKVKFWCRFTT